MKIDISDIKRSLGAAETIKETFDGELDGVELVEPLQVDLKVTNVGEGVLLSGKLDAKVALVCDRCATGYVEPLDVDIEELFLPADSPKEKSKAKESKEIEADKLCVFTYENNEIELDEVLRQNLLASLPFRSLCRPDCRGLCAQCGANLNTEVCTCVEVKEPDARWAALASLKKNSRQEDV